MIGEWIQEKERANKSINKWKRHPWFGTTNPGFGTTNHGFIAHHFGSYRFKGFLVRLWYLDGWEEGCSLWYMVGWEEGVHCDIWMDEMKVFTVIYGWMRGRCSLWYLDGWEEGVNCDIWLVTLDIPRTVPLISI